MALVTKNIFETLSHSLAAPVGGSRHWKTFDTSGEPGAQQTWQLVSLSLAEQMFYQLGHVRRKAPWGRGVETQVVLRVFCSAPLGLRFGGGFELAEGGEHSS